MPIQNEVKFLMNLYVALVIALSIDITNIRNDLVKSINTLLLHT